MTLSIARSAGRLLRRVAPLAPLALLFLGALPARSDVRVSRPAVVQAIEPANERRDAEPLPRGVALDVVLGEADTRFVPGGASRDRAYNVRLAAGRLDRTVVPAHGTLSFNAIVGPRTVRAGFREAPVIVAGRITDGIGGGVCQVAGTLHTAALRAGLEIARKQAHSRPSAYLPPGLDAMVAWPSSDLVITNPYPFAVLIDAKVTGPTLRVTLRGDAGASPAIVTSTVEEELPAPELITEDPTLAPGELLVDHLPVAGSVVRITRTRGAQSESWIVRYPPHARVVRVGPTSATVAVLATALAPPS